ncbi:TonB-dependent receptor domain-containing protein, partial [Pseudomonas aeruginosa]
NNISPRLGVVWQPVAAHALYTSFSKTYAPVGGGLIGITPENKNNRLSPEYTRQFETGVKSDWLEQQVTTTLSLYRLEMYNRRTRDPENPDIL